jgi:hypothetical protein
MPSSHSLNTLVVGFDDEHAVANAGLLLTATLTERLGIEALADELVDLGDRPGHYRPGRKVLTLLHALVAGGDCIDDAEVLATRADTGEVLPRTAACRASRVWPRRRAVRQRAGWTGPPRRRQRRVDATGRLGLLVRQGHRRVQAPPHPLLDHRAPDQHRHRSHRVSP